MTGSPPHDALKKYPLFIINISEDVPFLKSNIGKPSLKKSVTFLTAKVAVQQAIRLMCLSVYKVEIIF